VRGAAAVLVHGGGVTRDEGGFFTRLALGLAEAGMPSLRFDFRAHGESGGRQEDLTIAGVVNDIRAAVEYVQAATGSGPVNLVGTSFGGGISAFFAVRYPGQVRHLVLLNPLLDYKRRLVDEKPYWADDHIDEEAGGKLAEQGFVPRRLAGVRGREERELHDDRLARLVLGRLVPAERGIYHVRARHDLALADQHPDTGRLPARPQQPHNEPGRRCAIDQESHAPQPTH
jgi:pimeloyl-ACP methyl ester carboxylesterase